MLEDFCDIYKKYNNDFPIDIEKIIKELEIDVVCFPANTNVKVGRYSDEYQKKHNKYGIIINQYDSNEIARVVLAEELGKYLINEDIIKMVQPLDIPLKSYLFALIILMPTREFIKAEKNLREYQDIADYFNVPVNAVITRKELFDKISLHFAIDNTMYFMV